MDRNKIIMEKFTSLCIEIGKMKQWNRLKYLEADRILHSTILKNTTRSDWESVYANYKKSPHIFSQTTFSNKKQFFGNGTKEKIVGMFRERYRYFENFQ